MKFYCITKNQTLQKRWTTILAVFNPISRETVPALLMDEAVIVIHDEIVSQMSDAQKKSLFSLHVMILSTTPTFEQARFALELGAKGYGNTMMHESYLLSACHAIMEGNIWLTPEYITLLIQKLPLVPKKEINPLSYLSPREAEVAILLSQGNAHKDIAEKLNITVRTVKAHATAIYSRLNIKDRLALALLLHD